MNTAMEKAVVPDGGWGWAVVLGSTIVHFMITGTARSFGVYYLQFRDRFQQSSQATAWVVAISNIVKNLFGPLVGMLCEQYAPKYIAIVGGFIMSLGFILTAFANSIIYAYFTFGVVSGLGGALLYTPSYVIVGKYFDRNKGKAMAISTMGAGIGLIAIAPLTQMLLDTYSFFGTMLIMDAVVLHNVFAAMLYRPLPKPVEAQELQTLNETEKELTSPEDAVATQERQNRFPMLKKQLSILSNLRFLLYCLQMLCMTIAFNSFWAFLPAIAEQYGADRKAAALLLSVLGGADIAGRFLWGFFFDLKAVRSRRRLFHTLLGYPLSGLIIVTGLFESYWAFFGLTIAFGFLEGGFHGQRATTISEYVPRDKISSATGYVILFQGFGLLAGPPVAGLLHDIYNTYNICYFFGGAVLLFSTTILMIEYLACKTSKKSRKGGQNTPATWVDKPK